MEQIQNEITRFAEDIVCFTTIGFEPGIVLAAVEKCKELFAFGMGNTALPQNRAPKIMPCHANIQWNLFQKTKK